MRVPKGVQVQVLFRAPERNRNVSLFLCPEQDRFYYSLLALFIISVNYCKELIQAKVLFKNSDAMSVKSLLLVIVRFLAGW